MMLNILWQYHCEHNQCVFYHYGEEVASFCFGTVIKNQGINQTQWNKCCLFISVHCSS